MFIFNMKVNKNILSRIFFIIMLVIICAIVFYSVYIIFFKESKTVKLSDTIESDEVFEITSENYTNILRASNDNIDSYIGCKVHLTGYVYRLLDFKENQFVIARDMLVSDESSSTLVVGFLCECDNASDYEDGAWVDITGEIVKGDFDGDIALLKVISIKRTEKPDDEFVNVPDDTYIPTANMF